MPRIVKILSYLTYSKASPYGEMMATMGLRIPSTRKMMRGRISQRRTLFEVVSKKQIIRQPTKKDLPNVSNNFGESNVLETKGVDD